MTESRQGPGEFSCARSLARAALRKDAADLSPPVFDKAKSCLLDFLSAAFAARDLPWSRQAIATVQAAVTGASIIGTDIVAAPGDAAFANGTLGRFPLRPRGLWRDRPDAVTHEGRVIDGVRFA